MKVVVLSLLILLISFSIAGFLIMQKYPVFKRDAVKKSKSIEYRVYEDTEKRFKFIYPRKLPIIIASHAAEFELSPAQGKVIVQKLYLAGGVQPPQALISFCNRSMKKMCRIDSQIVFTNSGGSPGVLYYFSDASVSSQLKREIYGPIYGFNIPQDPGSLYKQYVIFYISNMIPDDHDKKSLEKVVSTFTVEQLPPSTISSGSSHVIQLPLK